MVENTFEQRMKYERLCDLVSAIYVKIEKITADTYTDEWKKRLLAWIETEYSTVECEECSRG